MSASTSSVAHVGLPKTASTFLQRYYFPRLSMRYVSTQEPFHWPKELDFIRETNSIWYQDLLSKCRFNSYEERIANFQQHVSRRRGAWQQAVERFAQRQKREKLLISAEGLCGLSPEIARVHADLLRHAGVGKIFFVVRKQTDYAVSLWRQLVLKEDRFARFVSFDDLFENGRMNPVVNLDWTEYIDVFDAEFGAQNVLVLPYEMMVRAPDRFFSLANQFLDVDIDIRELNLAVRENPSLLDADYTGYTTDEWPIFCAYHPLRRVVRKIGRGSHSFLSDLRIHYSMAIDKEKLGDFASRFVHINKRLQDRMGCDLGAYGYF